MPCVEVTKSDQNDCISDTVTDLDKAYQHTIETDWRVWRTEKKAGRQDTCENVKTCHVAAKEMICVLVLLHQEKSGLTNRLKIKGG